MRRTRVITAAVVAALACVALEAQQVGLLIVNPLPLDVRVAYDVESTQQRNAEAVLYVDDTEYRALTKLCTPTAPGSCEVTPEPAFFAAVNKAPFPHRVDVALRDSAGTSARASTVRTNPPQPPARTECPYVNQAGVLTPKAIGDDSVYGWNLLNVLDPEARRKHVARMKQLRAWGLDAQVLATDDGFHVWKDGRQRVFIYAPCVGPPQ